MSGYVPKALIEVLSHDELVGRFLEYSLLELHASSHGNSVAAAQYSDAAQCYRRELFRRWSIRVRGTAPPQP
jgi:hypothetical protein